MAFASNLFVEAAGASFLWDFDTFSRCFDFYVVALGLSECFEI